MIPPKAATEIDHMKYWVKALSLSLTALTALAGGGELRAESTGLRVPPGFSISEWAVGVADARSMALGDDGTVFVATRRDGRIHALRDRNGDHRADAHWILASELQAPNGIAYHEGALYVAETSRIWKWPGIAGALDRPPTPTVVRDGLPDAGHHGWRYIGFGPDGRLYLSIGAPCNVCAPSSLGAAVETASISSMRPDGSDWRSEARGVRNSVGFDFSPEDGRLWFTDNGRDWLGDDQPSDEINVLRPGNAHYGFPYCHAGQIADPEFGKQASCAESVAPQLAIGAHVAPLGLRFYRGSGFPEPWNKAAFVALHGSWNRSEKSGYRVVALIPGAGALRVEPFVTGFLDGQKVRGRPVDLLQLPDGSLLISDDAGGRILRVAAARAPSAH